MTRKSSRNRGNSGVGIVVGVDIQAQGALFHRKDDHEHSAESVLAPPLCALVSSSVKPA